MIAITSIMKTRINLQYLEVNQLGQEILVSGVELF